MNKLDTLLTLYLDSPFGNTELACWLFTDLSNLPYSMAGNALLREFKADWPAPISDRPFPLTPVVCRKCRSKVGEARAEIILDECPNCKGTPETEASKAITRFIRLGEETVAANLTPLIHHLLKK